MEVQQPPVDLEDLQRKLSAEQDSISSWVSLRKVSSEAIYDEHSRMLRENEDQILSLADQRRHLEEQGDQLRQRLADEADTVTELQQQLTQSQRQADTLPEAVQNLQQELREDLGRLQKRTAALKHMLDEKQHSLEALQTEVQRYRDNLGLVLNSSTVEEDNLQLVFTRVDPKYPHREFSFTICSRSPEQWEVTSCEPPVPALEEHLRQLNAHPRGFSHFVRSMRNAFKQIAVAS